ncbi:MAG: hypothetical protein R3234_08745 [Thermoanaerobaculia bacterium]|nr:hypothetical protein [Thermoanaerobaculia bacterium]
MPMKTAVVATSRKENERRVPLHPRHLEGLQEAIRENLWLESGYSRPFGFGDRWLEDRVAGLASREVLFESSELVLLAKPLPEDLRELPKRTVLWGWPHCVQQTEMTQAAIDRRLTLIAFEEMFRWRRDGRKGMHLLARNNEMAGYCGVLHGLEIAGIDGLYGRPRRPVTLLSFGSVSRGAAYALQRRGFEDVTVYTRRPPHLVADRIPNLRHRQMVRSDDGSFTLAVRESGERVPLVQELSGTDLIVNGTLQNPENPLMYFREGEEERLEEGTLIVDVSCDEGMGFPFARPTTFDEPVVTVGPVTYYAVDHTPSYLWRAASWEVSVALLPYLETVMEGPEAWSREPTIERAIEIREGRVLNPKILSFQGREEEYPHRIVD